MKNAPPITTAPINPMLYIAGTELGDTLFGTNNRDEMHGLGGNDFLWGGGGDDIIFGEAGNDTLGGEAGNDTLYGGIGNDTFIGGAGSDSFFGGEDFDTIVYASSSLGVTVDMVTGGVSNDAAGDSYNSIEKIVGTNYSDILSGDGNANQFDGGKGDDWLFGQGGSDVLVGGLGHDHLDGGSGSDTLVGGDGDDRLTGGTGGDIFSVSVWSGVDHITDFEQGIDHIRFTDAKQKQAFGKDGVLDTLYGEVAVAFGGQAGDAPDTLFFDSQAHKLYEVRWAWQSSDATWRVTETRDILYVDNGVTLTANDFWL